MFYIFSAIILPLPLYFDLKANKFIWENAELLTDDYIPVPVSLFFAGVYLLYCICRRVYSKNSKGLPLTNEQFVKVIVLTVFVLIYLVFVSEISIVRAVQLILPAVFFGILVLPCSNTLSKMGLVSLVSLCVFESLHSIFLFTHLDDPFDVVYTQLLDFYDGSIYSGLVSYPPVIYFYFVLALVCFVNSSPRYRGLYLIMVSLFSYFMFLLARKVLLVDVLTIVCLSLGWFVFCNEGRDRIYKLFFRIFGALLISIGLPIVIFGERLPLIKRTLQQVSEGDPTSGRTDIWFDFIDSINLSNLIVGVGGAEASHSHNFFLDIVLRSGLIGLILLLLLNINAMLSFFSYCFKFSKNYSPVNVVFICALIFSIVLQSLFNVGLTQIYLVLNWIYVIVLVSHSFYHLNKKGFHV